MVPPSSLGDGWPQAGPGRNDGTVDPGSEWPVIANRALIGEIGTTGSPNPWQECSCGPMAWAGWWFDERLENGEENA